MEMKTFVAQVRNDQMNRTVDVSVQAQTNYDAEQLIRGQYGGPGFQFFRYPVELEPKKKWP